MKKLSIFIVCCGIFSGCVATNTGVSTQKIKHQWNESPSSVMSKMTKPRTDYFPTGI